MEEYQAKVQTTEEVVHDVEESLQVRMQLSFLITGLVNLAVVQVFKEKAQCEIDPDKKAMMTSTLVRIDPNVYSGH